MDSLAGQYCSIGHSTLLIVMNTWETIQKPEKKCKRDLLVNYFKEKRNKSNVKQLWSTCTERGERSMEVVSKFVYVYQYLLSWTTFLFSVMKSQMKYSVALMRLLIYCWILSIALKMCFINLLCQKGHFDTSPRSVALCRVNRFITGIYTFIHNDLIFIIFWPLMPFNLKILSDFTVAIKTKKGN